MPDRHTITCHRCDEEGAKRFGVTVHRGLDAAGSLDNDVEYADLCEEHIILALKEFLSKLSHADAREWIAKWTRPIKTKK